MMQFMCYVFPCHARNNTQGVCVLQSKVLKERQSTQWAPNSTQWAPNVKQNNKTN